MDAYDEGYEDWGDGLELSDNPYLGEDESDARWWRRGWLAAAEENSMFGVGA